MPTRAGFIITAAVIETVLLAAGGPAAAQAPPAVSRPAEPPPARPPALRPYGILRPAVVVANGLESFGFSNFVAPTAAVNPVFNAKADDVGMSFQVTQTRLGLVVGEGYPARGTVEVDFVHFDQSSAITAAYPRVRQAFFEWLPREGQKLLVGQTWDLFAPLNTPSFDLVANMYLAGNAGFMRPQAMYLSSSDRFEYGIALGLQGPNNAAALTSVEYSVVPTVAGRAGLRSAGRGSLVASAIATRVRFEGPPPVKRHRIAFGGALSGELTAGPFNLRAESYAGSNLGNLGLLTLAYGSGEASVSEVGAWASAKYTPSPRHAAHLVAGGARLLDPAEMRLGYTPASGGTGAARVGANGPGISHNIVTRAGYAFSPGGGLSFFVEPFVMLTHHKLAASDRAAGLDADRVGYGTEAGGLFQF